MLFKFKSLIFVEILLTMEIYNLLLSLNIVIKSSVLYSQVKSILGTKVKGNSL